MCFTLRSECCWKKTYFHADCVEIHFFHDIGFSLRHCAINVGYTPARHRQGTRNSHGTVAGKTTRPQRKTYTTRTLRSRSRKKTRENTGDPPETPETPKPWIFNFPPFLSAFPLAPKCSWTFFDRIRLRKWPKRLDGVWITLFFVFFC